MFKSSSNVNRHSSASRHRGSREDTQPSFRGLLQPSLPSSQKEREVSASDRSVDSQHLRREPPFQDGNPGFYPGFYPTRTLGCFHGPVGRLLPRPYTPQFTEVSPFLSQRQYLPVPGFTFWPVHCAQSLHQTHGRRRGPPAPTRLNPPAVFRRLASTSVQSVVTTAGSSIQLGEAAITRPSSQLGKVRAQPQSGFQLCGTELPHQREHSSGLGLQNCKYTSAGSILSGQTVVECQGISIPSGHSELCSGLRSARQTSSAPTTVPLTISVESCPRVSNGQHSSTFVSPTPLDVVAGCRPVATRRSTPSPITVSPTHHRCEFDGLGCTFGTPGSHGLRPVVPSGSTLPYKQPGTQSGTPRDPPVPVSSAGSLSPCLHRQHHSSLPHPKTGGDTLVLPLSGDRTSLSGVLQSESNDSGQTHPRTAQRPCGRPFSEESNTPIGVDSPSGGSRSDFLHLRDPHGRPLCDQAESSSAPLCLTGLRPGGMGNRCTVPGLESPSRLRVPAFPIDSTSSTENQVITVPDPAGGPLVAPEILVQRPTGASSRSPEVSTSQDGPSITKGSRPTSKSASAPPSRLAVIRQSLRKKKFSSRAASLIAKARRSSTTKVYDAKWTVFQRWCRSKQINPLDPSPRRVADFLIFLFDKKKLAVSTIKGYRSMISHTLSFRRKSSIGSDPILSELIRSFELRRPISHSLAPKWDLSCVLWSLTKAPYEPLDQASLQFLTWKTVFLLTLASAKRRSEIHALSIEEGHLRFNASDGSVSLLCQAGFLAKTQLPSVAPVPFSIPSLSASCGRDDQDRLLCPVRALKFYLDRVKSIRAQRKRLFIPIKGKGNISAASISRWVASTIRKAYSSLSDRDISNLKISAHEVRALSASWAFVNHTPLSDILQATYWKNSSTFSAFYLRSFSTQRDNLSMLGPFVASSSVIRPSATLRDQAGE